MINDEWFKNLPVAVTVCDSKGVITDMNDSAAKVFEKDGGKTLIGQSVLDCHPEPSRSKLKNMLSEESANCYTIEKNGVKKLIYQTPWYNGQEYGGFVELSFEIPFDMPHFVRSNS